MAIPINDLEGPDLLKADYKREKITSKILAQIHKAELSKKKTVTIKLKGAVNAKKLPKWCQVITTSGLTTYDKKDGVYYGDGETLIAIDLEALGIQQKARQDAQRNLGLTVEKLEVGGPGGGPIPVMNYDELNAELISIAKEVAKKYARTRNKHKPVSPASS